ncbi:ABC transporter substrate-binding protein [Deinococcus cellulosilyticus]|uniref:Sugar ABC transporter substrate-binding protein n=1 Tax=Deinococcus cellulosilyticus (strain DSM 18568 / NBRC 106333 / KACC 11606 / 5516J-15) TaxID=1223518 RepID=A0A511N2U4_DEIC1|nr:extracellular solute-binding protein [Deinococcus cellulosilyticus]GEM47169.1 sugar ABC transporter substrate-binding protein [Deinococcus cellulosilyticus NBRC 106333 = KACC 11606]
MKTLKAGLLVTFALFSGAVAQKKVQIRWYIGLGTGSDAQQQPATRKVVERFNKSQNKIELVPEFVNYNNARDQLATRIAAGNVPDLVGPVGILGAASFQDQWLDLQPLIKKYKVDLSHVNKKVVDFYRSQDPNGIPYAIYPSFLFINKDLFDEAGLPYPPQKFGEKYQGKTWDHGALRRIGMLLTVDRNGSDATMSDFDSKNIVQYGYFPQYTLEPQSLGSMFGAGILAKGKTAQIPQQWIPAWQWFYDGMWKDHFIPTDAVQKSDAFGKDNVFNSGKLAIAYSHLWYTCCLDTAKDGGKVKNWDLAVVPSYNGKYTAKLNADTFRIMKGSKHKEEAFQVLMYLREQPELLEVYGAFPADTRLQPKFLKILQDKYAPLKINWQVAMDSLNYVDIPSHEAGLPNHNKALDAVNAFTLKLMTRSGLNIKQEAETLRKQLQGIFNEKK